MTGVHHAIWIVLFLGVATYRGSPEQRLPAGCSDCELRFELALDKSKYEVGEPIVLTMRLTNIGSAPVAMPLTSDVTGRHDAAALEALKAVVHDPDPDVSEQATIAVGWVAEASKPQDATRKDAVEVLRSVEPSRGRAGRQAVYWLARIGEG